MTILAFDPSGNYTEGKGTTGYAVGVDHGDGWQIILGDINARDYKTMMAYWSAHVGRFALCGGAREIVMEGYRLYNHAGKEAKIQANSTLETPQLIGALRMAAWERKIPVKIQYAADVKTRWSDEILVRLGYLDKRGQLLYYNGNRTNTHQRDALRHLLHYIRYNRKEKVADGN